VDDENGVVLAEQPLGKLADSLRRGVGEEAEHVRQLQVRLLLRIEGWAKKEVLKRVEVRVDVLARPRQDFVVCLRAERRRREISTHHLPDLVLDLLCSLVGIHGGITSKRACEPVPGRGCCGRIEVTRDGSGPRS
jgi:hypothetical protein